MYGVGRCDPLFHVHPEPQRVTLFGNRVFEDGISCHGEVTPDRWGGALSPGISVLSSFCVSSLCLNAN